jgi:2-dehydro-3-deoxyphosphogluconate aldolase / (4S)-4-hydroxy-2-oxoglutarate aldolase
MEHVSNILELPLIGILRGFTPAQLPNIIAAVLEGGLRNIEITMNSPDAELQIQEARALAGKTVNVGAGTVSNLKLLDQALEAGAQFIVTPSLNRDVVTACVERRIPICPGAFSPTEILEASELGATMVKIFPADAGGAAYISGLRGPFPNIKLLPTGGVDLETGRELLRAGAAGLGVGGPLFDQKRIAAGDWAWLQDQTRAFVRLFQSG